MLLRVKTLLAALMVALMCVMIAPPAHAGTPYCEAVLLGQSNNISIVCYDSEGNQIPPSQLDLVEMVGNIITVVVTETEEIIKTVVQTVPGPTSTVTVTAPPKPQPTHTVTVRPAPVVKTEYVKLPSDTRTVYIKGPTETRTKTVTVTETPEPTPGPTVTVTPEARQTVSPSDTMKAREDPSFFRPDIDWTDDDLSAGETGLGLLSALLLLAAIIGGMYYGFAMGRKSGESGEADFLRTLLDKAKID